MKKILLLPIVGFFFISCSVDPMETELHQSPILEMSIVSNLEEAGCAGPDNSKTITFSEAVAIQSWDEVRKLYGSLLPSYVPGGGTWDPSIWDLINLFNEKGVGDYTTVYTLDLENCKDSVVLTITVIPDDQSTPICDGVDAGPDNSITITQTEAEAIESWDEVRKLYASLLAPWVPGGGVFDPTIWNLIDDYWERGLGEYTTRYTITEGECTDSALLTVIVVADSQTDPICEGVDAGPDNSMTITYSEAAAIESWDEVRKLYASLIAPGVNQYGTFDPTIWDLIRKFQEQGIGDYSTQYIITEGDCTDSATITITVIPD